MKLGSLFDGAGTAPFAGILCGINPVWASEIEKFPRAVTEKRFPQMQHLGDVTKIDGSKIEPVDVIVFGSPCQDLSVAGKRAGLEGERSGLFSEAIRIIKEMRRKTHGEYPTFAVWENVPGAFSSNCGEDFRAVLEELCRCKDGDAVIPGPSQRKWSDAGEIVGNGYSVAWRVLDAQFWGVPQRRRRIYAVLDLGGERAGEILFEREGLSRSFAESRKTWEKTSRIFRDSAEGAGECYDARGNGDGKICPTITGDHENRITDYTAVVVGCFEAKSYDSYRKTTVSATIKQSGGTNAGGSETLVCAGFSYKNSSGSGGVGYAENKSATLLSGKEMGVLTKRRVRRLTPTECARLQGMPDWWCADIPHADSSEYKMWGNGMALPNILFVLEGIAEKLRERKDDK